MKKPVVIRIVEKLSSRPNPRWNYGKYVNLDGKSARLEPCCLKAKPCWECK